MSRTTIKPFRTAELVHTAYDSFGALVSEHYYFPNVRILYVQWHGYIIGEELVRAAQVGLLLHKQLQPVGLLLDTRGSGGNWGDGATPWLMYEWIPGIKANSLSLRGIAYVLDPETPVPYDIAQMFAQMDLQFEFRLFYTVRAAWRWLRQHTMPPGKEGSDQLMPPLPNHSGPTQRTSADLPAGL
jgi:hypothetical protein